METTMRSLQQKVGCKNLKTVVGVGFWNFQSHRVPCYFKWNFKICIENWELFFFVVVVVVVFVCFFFKKKKEKRKKQTSGRID